MGFRRYKAGTGNNNYIPSVWKVTPPNSHQNVRKNIGSKRPAPESFIDALLPALKTPSSPDETTGKVPKRRRIFLSQTKLKHAALLQNQSGHQLGVMECLLASRKATQAAADKQLAFNNAKVNFNSVEEGTLNFSAFKTNRMGKERSSEAERQAISRA
jgi:hypothetical protein